MRYWGYVGRRAVQMVLTFAFLCVVFGFLVNGYLEVTIKRDLYMDAQEFVYNSIGKNLVPGQMLTPVELEQKVNGFYRQYLKARGLEDPYIVRVTRMSWSLMRLDFGTSKIYSTVAGRPHQRSSNITAVVMESLSVTLGLFGLTYAIQLALAYAIGLRHATRPRPSRKSMLLGMTMQGMSIPILSLLAVFVFAYCLRWHPTDAWAVRLPSTYAEPLGQWLLDLVHHFWVPFVVLIGGTFWQTAFMIEKLTRSAAAEEYVDAARARGLPERRILFGHIARSSSPALVTYAVQGLFIALWGSFVVERLFGLPGIGSLLVDAIAKYERFTVAGILAIVTLLFQFGLFLLDITYGFLDPRIRVGAKAGAMR